MLSGEGNAGERWKKKIGLISKKATSYVQHTFFVHFFAFVLHDYSVKLGNVVPVLFHIFSLPFIFVLHWCPLPFLILSPPLQIFHVLPTKKYLLCFLSLALLDRPFSPWASLACCLLSLFLCLSPAPYSKFVDMIIMILIMILIKAKYFRGHGYNFRFPFLSLLTLKLSLLYKTPVAMRFLSKITSSCI